MKVSLFHIDAFTGEGLAGNGAAVVLLDRWLEDETLLRVAAQQGFSETAFLLPDGDRFDLRWFTPVTEVDLCGHATLAAGHVVLHDISPTRGLVAFRTRSGEVLVERGRDHLVLDFPARPAHAAEAPDELLRGVGRPPREVLATPRDWLLVYDSEADIRSLRPDFELLKRRQRPGVIVTAPGDECDFVSRFFAPFVGVDEDPVTGSAHCALTPYWARRLGRRTLRALQVSARGGELFLEERGDRVRIGGRVTPRLEGSLDL